MGAGEPDRDTITFGRPESHTISVRHAKDMGVGAGGLRAKCYMTEIAAENVTEAVVLPAAILAPLGRRSIVLVGMMGVGKSSIGRRLAARLGVPFVDADTEIEKAAGMSIADIFSRHGEADFRSGEARVIARLLESGPQVLATGGGAFMNPNTRDLIRAKGISVWLKAEFDVLLRRINKRKNDRPLLQTDDPGETLRALLVEREPAYAHADLTVHSREVAHDAIVSDIMTALASRLKVPASPEQKAGA
jgi:shikimate kinase